MSLIQTNNNRITYRKAEHLEMIPYVYDGNYDDYVLGSVVYDLSAIIGDTITLSQDSNDISTKENEFTGAPIVKNVTAGNFNFSAKIIDFQSNVMKLIFGAMTASDGAVAMPSDFETIFALVHVRFKNSDTPDIVIPKLAINSKFMIEQLRSNVAQGTIEGTAMNMRIASFVGTTLSQFVNAGETSVTNMPITPMVFVPRTNGIAVFHHELNTTTNVFSKVDLSGPNSVRLIQIEENDTDYSNYSS